MNQYFLDSSCMLILLSGFVFNSLLYAQAASGDLPLQPQDSIEEPQIVRAAADYDAMNRSDWTLSSTEIVNRALKQPRWEWSNESSLGFRYEVSLVQKVGDTDDWIGDNYFVAVCGSKSLITSCTQQGLLRAINVGEHLFQASNAAEFVKKQAGELSWFCAFDSRNRTIPIQMAPRTVDNSARVWLDVADFLKALPVETVNRRFGEDDIEFACMGTAKVPYTVRLRMHSAAESFRRESPIRDVAIHIPQQNTTITVTPIGFSCVDNLEGLQRQQLIAAKDRDESLPELSDTIWRAAFGKVRPTADELNEIFISGEGKQVQAEIGRFIDFISALCLKIRSNKHDEIAESEVVVSKILRGVMQFALLVKADLAPGVPYDCPVGCRFSSYASSPVMTWNIIQFLCRVIEHPKVDPDTRVHAVEALATWGYPSTAKIAQLLSSTWETEHLLRGILLGGWREHIDSDALSALEDESKLNYGSRAGLAATEVLVGSDEFSRVSNDAFEAWFQSRIVRAENSRRRVAIGRLTATNAGLQIAYDRMMGGRESATVNSALQEILLSRVAAKTLAARASEIPREILAWAVSQ